MNKHASALAKLSWKKLTPEQRKQRTKKAREATAQRFASMTKEERSAYGKKMVEAKWRKRLEVLTKEDL